MCRERRLRSLLSCLTLVLSLLLAHDLVAAEKRRAVGNPGQLMLAAPELRPAVVSGVELSIGIPHHYTGSGHLVFSLEQPVSGMVIDAESGTLRWTPPGGAEGTSVDVRVRATDGISHAQLDFSIPVARTIPLAASVSGATLTITAPGTLKGLAFTIPPSAGLATELLSVGHIASGDAPALPERFERISDFLRATSVRSAIDPITVTLPASMVPPGRAPEDLRLLVYTQSLTGAEGHEWLAVASHLDVRPDGSVTLTLGELGALACIAVENEPAAPVQTAASSKGSDAASVLCSPFRLSNGRTDPRRVVCTIAGPPASTVVVRDIGRASAWRPPATAEEIAQWVAAARASATDVGLLFRDSIDVVIEPMPRPTWLGFASSVDSYGTIHLSSASLPRAVMQSTVAHEFFHHAQGNTFVTGRDNLLWDSTAAERDWLTEGTARWFEDVVFDDLDIYRQVELQPLPAVLRWGLSAAPQPRIAATRSYARFAFFKLLASRCPKLDLAYAINSDAVDDSRGVFALANAAHSWQCRFAEELAAPDHSSLGLALLEYSYATIKQNSIAWLDENERSYDFQFLRYTISPDRNCSLTGACPSWATTRLYLPPLSASVIEVDAATLQPQIEALIGIDPGADSVKAWIGNDETGGFGDGRWRSFNSANRTEKYAENTRAPRMMIILVNESPDFGVEPVVRASLRNTGSQIVPFSRQWSYAPTDVVIEKEIKPYVTWNASTEGAIEVPGSATVTLAPQAWPNQQFFRACVPNSVAFTARMDAGLAAGSAQLTGQAPHPTVPGATLEWQYSNARTIILQNEPTGSVNGSSISFTIPVVKGASFGRVFGGCIAYDLDTWIIDKDGVRRPQNHYERICQTTTVLELLVGIGPPSCP